MPSYKRIKNAQRDVPDQRDWMYRSPLIQLKDYLNPPENLNILDQKRWCLYRIRRRGRYQPALCGCRARRQGQPAHALRDGQAS